ncbi:PaaI family thioesterase [Bradyrhizobium sp. P5_C12]
MMMGDECPASPENEGLKFFRELLRTGAPAAPICKPLEFQLSAARHGSTEFTAWPGPQFANPGGVVHGGYLAVILSSAMSCAVHTTLDEGESFTTTNFNVNLARPLKPGPGPVIASGLVVHRGRQGATAEGRIVDNVGKLLAHGTTTCMIFAARRQD